MDILTTVLSALGVNQTVYIQFVITIIFLALARYIFVNDLLRVLETRSLGTHGAENDAEKYSQEAAAAKNRYEKMLNEKVLEVNNEYSDQRKKIVDEIEGSFKAEETKIIAEYQGTMNVKKNELDKVRQSLKKDIQTLADELLAKIKK